MSEAHSTRAHAKLAPSSAYRWVACPGSVRLTEGIEEKSSSYAAEGTAAHELAAFCLGQEREAEKYLGYVIDVTPPEGGRWLFAPGQRQSDGKRFFAVDEEMVEAVGVYIDTVRDLIPATGEYEFEVEQRLDMTHIHREIFGTGDALVYQADARWLHVLDFKYGKGVAVEVKKNKQLLLYGAGAARRYHNRALKGITLHIVQPRAPHPKGPVRDWPTDPLTLMEFEAEIARDALETEKDDAPLVAGEWCRFCKAFPVCPAARERSLNIALEDFSDMGGIDAIRPPHKLSQEQMAEVLKEAEFIGNWVKAVQEFAHAEAVAGRVPSGFKLVAKRATRKWKGDDALEVLTMVHGLDADDVLTERELKSPAAVEKAIGKKAFAPIEAELVTKVSSGTNLVLEADPRPAVKANAQEEFA